MSGVSLNQIAPPSPARSGGAASPHGIVPRPAASYPQPEGATCSGTQPPCNLTPAGLPSSRGLSWTQEEIERLAELRAEGRTREECAAILGRPIWGIDSAIKRRALPRVRDAEWNAEEFRTLLRMKMARKTIAEIAAKLGRSQRATSAKWQKMAQRLPESVTAPILHDMLRRGGNRPKGGA